jgi:regulator of cell morphogenesis and NO signaling
MAHPPPVSSPPGTPVADRTVGELVAMHPQLSRVFQARAIDFCCQGNRTVREACDRKGCDVDTLTAELNAALAGPQPPTNAPADLTPAALIAHIVEAHHEPLRRELPRLHAMTARVAQRHGGHTPSLIEVHHVFTTMATELSLHLHH